MHEYDLNLSPLAQAHDDEVDLTNLADPLLVLSAMLILTWQSFAVMATDLVEGPDQSAGVQEQPRVSISVMEDGRISWGQDCVEMEQIERRFDAVKKSAPQTTIYVAGERKATHGAVEDIKVQAIRRGLKVKGIVRQPRR